MSSFYRPPSSRAVRPMRARRGRRLALPAALLLAIASVAGGVFLTLRLHPRFAVTRVVLEGVPDARRAEAEEVTDPWIGRPLLFTDIDAPVRQLSSRAWVASAVARRVVPDTIVVRVVSRPPVAVARRGKELWTVDRSGSWLGPYAGRAVSREDDFALLDPGAASDGVARAATLLGSLKDADAALSARLSEIEVLPEGFALTDGVAHVRLLVAADADGWTASLAWRGFLAVRPELDRRGLVTSEADLRFADRIVLKAPADSGRGKT